MDSGRTEHSFLHPLWDLVAVRPLRQIPGNPSKLSCVPEHNVRCIHGSRAGTRSKTEPVEIMNVAKENVPPTKAKWWQPLCCCCCCCYNNKDVPKAPPPSPEDCVSSGEERGLENLRVSPTVLDSTDSQLIRDVAKQIWEQIGIASQHMGSSEEPQKKNLSEATEETSSP
ncbi:hypothetical protein JRQ81_011790 [Phrynocephalus forsythii]|uniref:Uncharacterized protein n=1 Tax=Phrynocephalus forsythii TaxID=171643 RepID=A0A9Q0X8H8_9SAUR|nr:hypothetical protein JRQ81_011790 [Phrynocephalus forsythii]